MRYTWILEVVREGFPLYLKNAEGDHTLDASQAVQFTTRLEAMRFAADNGFENHDIQEHAFME